MRCTIRIRDLEQKITENSTREKERERERERKRERERREIKRDWEREKCLQADELDTVEFGFKSEWARHRRILSYSQPQSRIPDAPGFAV